MTSKLSPVLCAFALTLLPLPVLADQTTQAAQIEMLGTRPVQIEEDGTVSHRLETRISDCVVTFDHFKPHGGGERLEWSNTIPLTGLNLDSDAQRAKFFQYVPNPAAPEDERLAVIFISYTMREGQVMKRLVPSEKDPKPPLAAEPVIIDGTEYRVADRTRGVIAFFGIEDSNGPRALSDAIIDYRRAYCLNMG